MAFAFHLTWSLSFFINSIISLTSIILIYNESFKELKKIKKLMISILYVRPDLNSTFARMCL